MEYRRILLPFDGSSVAERAVEHAITLARALSAAVVVLQVVDSPRQVLGIAGVTDAVLETLPESVRVQREEAEADVQRAVRLLEAAGVRARGVLREGQTGPAILAAAIEEQCDLIVMCTHGKGGAQRGTLGTISDYVARHSRIPVFLTRPKD